MTSISSVQKPRHKPGHTPGRKPGHKPDHDPKPRREPQPPDVDEPFPDTWDPWSGNPFPEH